MIETKMTLLHKYMDHKSPLISGTATELHLITEEFFNGVLSLEELSQSVQEILDTSRLDLVQSKDEHDDCQKIFQQLMVYLKEQFNI